MMMRTDPQQDPKLESALLWLVGYLRELNSPDYNEVLNRSLSRLAAMNVELTPIPNARQS